MSTRGITDAAYQGAIVFFLWCSFGCKKLVRVDPPLTSTNASLVYSSDATAISVMTGLYATVSSGNIKVPGMFASLTLCAGLSADELVLSSGGFSAQLNAYYTNTLGASVAGYEFWQYLYSYVFTCNSAIEGLQGAVGLTPAVDQQLMGEAKFMRALCYFYLVNLYGDVPLELGTDYKVNSLAARMPKAQVYQQMVADLKDAQGLLNGSYPDVTLLKTTTERVRPTRWAAMALLARVYLYTGDWPDAEAQADSVIAHSTLYGLSALGSVFLKNSTEAIWQLQPVTTGSVSNTSDAVEFILPVSGPSAGFPVYLSNHVTDSFEAGDKRRTTWVGSVTAGGKTYNYAYKYKVNSAAAAVSEYLMVLRLAEQYLIRAEARVQQGNTGGVSDLNIIRTRAGLAAYAGPIDKASLLSAILHERKMELFCELGHRWLDLKRTGTANAVMSGVTPGKGGVWSGDDELYPLSITDVQEDPHLGQNPGY